MPAHHYHFVESWFIPFPPAQVWDVLADGKLLPRWWEGVYLEAMPLAAYPGPAVGNQYRARARGFLPYRLHFLLTSAALERPTLVQVQIAGDLTGTWTARLTPRDGGTHVAIEQIVTADKPLLRWFSPLLKPLFAWNHRWTTPRGERGLTAYLQQQGSAVEAAAGAAS